LESNDIDVAIADMTGVTFAEHFVSFLEEKGVPVTSIAKVERNPDQSKHLETAKITVLGRELDLVSLRSEEYAEDSRIPSDVVRHHAGFGCSHVAE
jgi:tRNA nucleotidyltransferase (CCA-adding enzyme)